MCAEATARRYIAPLFPVLIPKLQLGNASAPKLLIFTLKTLQTL